MATQIFTDHYNVTAKTSVVVRKRKYRVWRLVFDYHLWARYFTFNFHVALMSLLLLLMPNNKRKLKAPIGKITCSGY